MVMDSLGWVGSDPARAGTRGDTLTIPFTTSGTGFHPSQRGHEQYPGAAAGRGACWVPGTRPWQRAAAAELHRSATRRVRSAQRAPHLIGRQPTEPVVMKLSV